MLSQRLHPARQRHSVGLTNDPMSVSRQQRSDKNQESDPSCHNSYGFTVHLRAVNLTRRRHT